MATDSQKEGIKVVLLGDAATGKSSLLLRYATGQFSDTIESTIGAAFKSKTLQRGGMSIRLDIWDTAGQERYRSILPMYYRNASAAVVVVDITDAQSLKVADRWIMDIHQRAVNSDCYIILALNKVDLEDRALTTEAVQTFCAEKGIDYIETSAKSGYNVSELFDKICDACLVLDKSEASGVISCSAPATPSKVGSWRCDEGQKCCWSVCYKQGNKSHKLPRTRGNRSPCGGWSGRST